ncbi:hypothetical protein L7F22_067898 [Adiantum nelumboides]|nr:hypothetical protein [Adiantum nelumboides]
MLTPNPRIVFVKRPIGQYKAGEHTIFDSSKSIDIENVPLNGGFLTRLIFLSPEPYLRHRMREPKESGYSSTWKLQAPPTSFGLIEVIRSEDPTIKVGTKMYANTPWELYTVQPYAESRYDLSVHDPTPGLIDFDSIPFSPVENPDPTSLPWTAFAGPLGIPGFAAYFGWREFCQDTIKKGQIVFVSSAAGATGSLVVQLAKQSGAVVIGSAGTDEKCEKVKRLGADFTINYKKQSIENFFKDNKFLIDFYWDNVGGKTLEEVLLNMNLEGTIICCGQVAEYDLEFKNNYGIKSTIEIFKRRLRIFGFIQKDLRMKYWDDFLNFMPKMLITNEIKFDTYDVQGLENSGKALMDTLEGKNTGKTVVLVSEPSK